MAQTQQQINKYSQVGYGLTNALQTLALVPVLSGDATHVGRAPTTADKLPIGTLWIWVPQNTAYLLTSIVANLANWEVLGGGQLAPNSIALPNTNAAGTTGFISFGGVIGISNTGTRNDFFGAGAGNPGAAAATGTDNTAMGDGALAARTTGNGNSAFGSNSLHADTTGSNNVGLGFSALAAQTTASQNVGVGRQAGAGLTTGGQNVMIGDQAGDTITTGTGNIIIGVVAGSAYVAAESNNICIDSAGVVGDTNTITIGTAGGGAGQQNRCFIAGIRGITTGQNNAIAVLVDSNGQLGTVSSSARYKNNIKSMDASLSEKVYDLRPVTFSYKSDKANSQQVGLIAEEVAAVLPELVSFGPDGQAESVKYHDLPVLLLKEIQSLKAMLAAMHN